MTATKGSDGTTSATKGKAARDLLAVGQRWLSGSEEVVITSLDDEPYPVQYKWADGLLGRDDVAGFLESFERPTSDWLAAILADRSHQAAIHEEELREARAALTTIAAEECAWTGSYADCWEAIANPHENFDGPCPRCIARRALGASQQTGTPKP